ncbi:hypothetical protein BH24ACI3_BH24ACI3_11170 [soil metagenome]
MASMDSHLINSLTIVTRISAGKLSLTVGPGVTRIPFNFCNLTAKL